MLFTSYAFIFFVGFLLFVYYHIPKKHQWKLLLFASLCFYASFGPAHLCYILFTIASTWFCGVKLQENLLSQKNWLDAHKSLAGREEKKEYKLAQKDIRTRMQALCIVLNVGILAVVKYANFFIGNMNGLLSIFGTGSLSFVSIAMPLGISFYTLQSIGYLIDVGRGTVEAEKNPFKLALFISFFPQVVQGPIGRLGDLKESLFSEHSYDPSSVASGLERVLWGFFKKLVVADRLMPLVSGITSDVSSYNGIYAAIGMLVYTVELYADFTGGIDISIGVAEAFGVRLQENFLRPYFSTSLKEYWRRWHISMCSWFRDYLFYPVSTSKWMQNISKNIRARFGQKAGKRLPVYISSFIVWFTTGLWHGASWNFIVWGLLNFVILMVSEECEPLYESFHAKHSFAESKGYHFFMMARTFLLVCVLNLFDCYAKVSDTLYALASIFVVHNAGKIFDGSFEWFGLGASDFVVAGLGTLAMLFVSIEQEKAPIRARIADFSYPKRALVWSLLFLCVLIFGAYGIGYDSAQFIYNRF